MCPIFNSLLIWFLALLHETYNGIYYYFFQIFMLLPEYHTDARDDFDESTYFEDLTLINAFPPLVISQQDMPELLRYPTYSQAHKTDDTTIEAGTVVEWGWGLSEEDLEKYKEEIRGVGRPPHHL